MKFKSILHQLDFILKAYHPDSAERRRILDDILEGFVKVNEYSHKLTETASLILSKDTRGEQKARRYPNTPFPLLSNLEYFCNTPGEWNDQLQHYGIKTRVKSGDTPQRTTERIYLYYNNTYNSRGNNYLKRQYKRLAHYRQEKQIIPYWELSWKLMTRSWSYKIASLNSWKPLWYKELDLLKLKSFWRHLGRITHLEIQQGPVRNVWIESPRGKWRQLGIPSLPWRLYLHMLNQFLSYLYSPSLPPEIYDGFLYNRGCKSWWETLLWGPLLKNYPWILEVDFSSGFPNLNLHSVRKALLSSGLLPPSLVNLILTHLKSPLIESTTFPTLETFIENKENQAWRKSDRSVHMGLGISPLMYVITIDWALRELKLLNPLLTYKWYADDGSLYFTTQWLKNFLSQLLYPLQYLRNLPQLTHLILNYFNNLELFREVGMRFCMKKSGMVRANWLWLKPFKSLGLTLYTEQDLSTQKSTLQSGEEIPLDLKASTRGRGANPTKGTPPTEPSLQPLNFLSQTPTHPPLTLKTLIQLHKKYFGMLLSKLYNPNSLKSLPLRKTGLYDNVHPRSVLGHLLRRKFPRYNKSLPRIERYTQYNTGSRLNELLLNLSSHPVSYNHPLLELDPQLKRLLTPDWPSPSPFSPLKVETQNPLKTNDPRNWTKEYFKKYSELNLNVETLTQYKKDYGLLHPPK